MAIDSDNSISLPTPPPPRPVARRDAIEAALRRFDGAPDSPAKKPQRSWWASHQRSLGALATAAIIAVVSIPIALNVLNDQPRPTPQAKAPVDTRPVPASDISAPPPPKTEQTDEAAAEEVPRSKLPLEPHEDAASVPFQAEQKASIAESAAPALAAPPASYSAPPPPPPPPPAPAPERDDSAYEAGGSSVIVTGSRIPQPDIPSSQHGALAAKRAADSLKAISPSEAYARFLPRLQSAIRSGDRRAVSGLIQYPLRVNAKGGPRIYSDRKSVEKDFDRIFTPHVRSAILAQRADGLFVRDQGAMIGDGEVWFDQTCRNSDCSQVGPVRIKAINP